MALLVRQEPLKRQSWPRFVPLKEQRRSVSLLLKLRRNAFKMRRTKRQQKRNELRKRKSRSSSSRASG